MSELVVKEAGFFSPLSRGRASDMPFLSSSLPEAARSLVLNRRPSVKRPVSLSPGVRTFFFPPPPPLPEEQQVW